MGTQRNILSSSNTSQSKPSIALKHSCVRNGVCQGSWVPRSAQSTSSTVKNVCILPKQYSFLRLFYMYDMYYVFMTLVRQCILHTKITFNPSQAKNNFVELSCWQHATTTRCHLVYTLLLSEIASLGHAERVRFLPDTHTGSVRPGSTWTHLQ